MIKTSIDSRDFDKAMNEYKKFSKRSVADIINAKLYYIARNATMTTQHSDKSKISSELTGPSRDYPRAPLGAILVNKQLKADGKSGLRGEKMTKAIEKLIRKRNSSINFVRSGWKNAIQDIERYLKTTGEFRFVQRWSQNAPVSKDAMKKRTTKSMGSARFARIERSPRNWGEIENSVHGSENGNDATLSNVKIEGLQQAVDKETASMRIYIERKLNEGAKQFNR